MPRVHVSLLLPALVSAQDMHAAIQSTRGEQHKLPLVSDDMVVGFIMIMFLLLFAFGALAAMLPSIALGKPHRTLTLEDLPPFLCAQGSNNIWPLQP